MITDGRFILGLGTGYHKTEFFALGVDFDERNALFDEALDVMLPHWCGEKFGADGTALQRAGRHRTAAPARTDPDLDRRQRQDHPPSRATGCRAGCR